MPRKLSRAAEQTAIRELGRAEQDCYHMFLLAIRSPVRGVICEEAEQRLHRPHQSLGARLSDLQDVGLFIDSGRRRCTSFNCPAIVWVPGMSRAAGVRLILSGATKKARNARVRAARAARERELDRDDSE